MVTLQADNRQLTLNTKFSYLTQNYLSAVSSIQVVNSTGYAVDDYLLLGEFGSETAEVVQIQSITSATHTLVLVAATSFAHAESTKVSVIKYNQVRFYHTTGTTFSASEPVTAYTNIDASSIYSKGYDTTNTTGYGWFVFYNPTTAKATQNSNAIPYAGFAENSVKRIYDDFFSLLNNREMKLISHDDFFSWLNEAYAISRNELNLVNKEYHVAAVYELTVSASLAEYSVPSDFSKLLSVYDTSNDVYIESADIDEIDEYNDLSTSTTKYYIRNGYIGFVPTPDSGRTYNIRYQTKPTALNSYYDTIDFPDNNYYFLKDFLLFRAAPKLNRMDAQSHYDLFMVGLNRLKLVSHKANANKDSWEPDPTTNV